MKTLTSDELRRFVSDRTATVPRQCSNLPTISIVTPSFNQGQFLERAILSVLNQNYDPCEYLVFDGGSTDESSDVLRKHQSQLAFWESGRDGGQAAAVKKGFRMSCGEILGWLNADDMYPPDTLYTVARAFADNPEADVVYGNMYTVDINDRITGDRRATRFLRSSYLRGHFDMRQPATFWRRAVYFESGELDEGFQFALDTDLFIRFAMRGANFRYIREFLACCRLHSESKTSTMQSVSRKERGRIQQWVRGKKQYLLPDKAHRFGTMCVRCIEYARQGDLCWAFRRGAERLRRSCGR